MTTSAGARAAASNWLRCAVLILMAALATVLTVWLWPQTTRGWMLLLLAIVPLLLPLPGLLRGNRYTYAWCTLLTIGYMALALTEVIANPPQRLLPAAALFVAFGWFVALIGFLRATRTAAS